MSTIKVNTIQTVNGTGEIKVSNPILLGHTAKVDGINDGDGVLGTGSQIQLHGASPVLDIFSYSATTSTHGGINFMKSKSNTVGTNLKIAENDIVGSIQFGGYDDNDYASIAGKIDFQMGGAGINPNDTAGEMVFYTTTDGQGGSGSTERVRLHSNGNLSVPSGNFKASNGSTAQYYNGGDATSGNWHEFNSHVGNETILAITCHHTGTNNEGIAIRHVSDTDNTSSGFISCANDVNGLKFKVEGNGNVKSATNSYGSTSDERLKSDIKDAKSQWDDIKQLRLRNFKKYDTKDLVHLGLIAQEAEKISPNIVSDSKPTALDIKHDASFGTLYKDGDTIPDGKKVGDVKEIKERVKGIKYSILYMKSVKALQEAMARIETLEEKVKSLEKT